MLPQSTRNGVSWTGMGVGIAIAKPATGYGGGYGPNWTSCSSGTGSARSDVELGAFD